MRLTDVQQSETGHSYELWQQSPHNKPVKCSIEKNGDELAISEA